jgi:hypothetical protein
MVENENTDDNNTVKPLAEPAVEDDLTAVAGNNDTQYDGNGR